jgi:methyltransferase (TIGR00027 family)
VDFIEVDLERAPLGESLDRAGQDPAKKSVFLWEGVTMYLSEAAVESTLAAIAGRSAPGSGLIMSYWEPPRPTPAMRFRLWALSKVGEPIRSTFTRERMQAMLAHHGFERVDDGGTVEWSARYLPGRFLSTPERVIWAERRADSGTPSASDAAGAHGTKPGSRTDQ